MRTWPRLAPVPMKSACGAGSARETVTSGSPMLAGAPSCTQLPLAHRQAHSAVGTAGLGGQAPAEVPLVRPVYVTVRLAEPSGRAENPPYQSAARVPEVVESTW